MHFMPNNDLEGNMSHFILIVRTQKKILCFQKLHFKFLELQNCIWGSRIQDPVSFPALIAVPLWPEVPTILGPKSRSMPW